MEARFNLFANPLAAKVFKAIGTSSKVIADSSLDERVRDLVMLRVSQINGCGYCTDMHAKDALHAGEDPTRLNLVAAWRDASVFTEAERAALDLAEDGTRIADDRTGVDDAVWEAARKHYDDEQLAALVMLIAMMNAVNRMNVITGNPAGGYVVGQFG